MKQKKPGRSEKQGRPKTKTIKKAVAESIYASMLLDSRSLLAKNYDYRMRLIDLRSALDQSRQKSRHLNTELNLMSAMYALMALLALVTAVVSVASHTF